MASRATDREGENEDLSGFVGSRKADLSETDLSGFVGISFGRDLSEVGSPFVGIRNDLSGFGI